LEFSFIKVQFCQNFQSPIKKSLIKIERPGLEVRSAPGFAKQVRTFQRPNEKEKAMTYQAPPHCIFL
jgi:hypothetical protein